MAAWFLMILLFAVLIPLTAMIEHEENRPSRRRK